MNIDQRVQEIWSGHESVPDGFTDEGQSYNPSSASLRGIKKGSDRENAPLLIEGLFCCYSLSGCYKASELYFP